MKISFFRSAMSSPRAWGCFYIDVFSGALSTVFPTCVGVFPLAAMPSERIMSLPHVRGGVSSCSVSDRVAILVFPTCVGVFPSTS